MLKCENYGTEKCDVQHHSDGANFCWSCGGRLKLVQETRCECGFQPDVYDKFCSHCGKEIKR